MSTSCRKFFKNLSMYSNSSLLVYEVDSKIMLRYKDGSYKTMPVPAVLEKSLQEEETVIGFFSKGGSKTIVYFLRAVVENIKCVCVVKDTWAGESINDFFKAYSAYCTSVSHSVGELSEKDSMIINIYRLLFDADPEHFTSETEASSIRKEIEEKINELRNVINEKEAVIWESEGKLERLSSDLREANGQIRILRNNYDSIRVLVDNADTPLFYISYDYNIVNANKAAAIFSQHDNPIDLVGKKCYEVFFNVNEPCSWCRLEQVTTTGESFTCTVSADSNNLSKPLEIYFFPITDSAGDVTSCGCMLSDKTNAMEMEISMAKVKDQLRTLKKAKITDINEIQELKKIYYDLSRDYAALVKRNEEMAEIIEKLKVSKPEDNSVGMKNELAHLHEEVRNYKISFKNLQSQYLDLRKRSFFQIERLIKIMDSPKYYVSHSELKEALKVLKTSLNELKRNESTNPM